jgi:hypothetical protein
MESKRMIELLGLAFELAGGRRSRDWFHPLIRVLLCFPYPFS